ncbi:uncharacterized protein LOC133930543 isoform X1 [Phragmites australis]|uniref:uncharacterized protein LOC133930543 isoform X1 n=1 Tax=Phragmites australis TaxID=29695 RepID=UPI002D78EAB8|nr:uncharacterized protein LOC133930543 isoform X1 [Phragmites australis]
MSFLAGRLAAKEGSYFLQESKNAAGRLAQKLPAPGSAPGPASASAQPSPDVLPEILRHSVPIKGTPPPAEPSLSASSRWALPPGGGEVAGASPDALNPLRSYVSLPQATFGPKRWQLPNEQPHYSVSTANERRRDRNPPPMDPEKLKAVIAGYSQIGKAFVAATILVFGGATAVLLYTADKLQLHSVDDVRTKGKDAVRPQADMIREQIAPLRSWAEEMRRKWHFEGDKEKSIIVRELSRALGARTPRN